MQHSAQLALKPIARMERSARTPLYLQLEGDLRAQAADLPAGALMPSERELCTIHGVSRTTVRKTIGRLVAEGLLSRAHGYATYVAHPKIQQTVALHGFTSDIAQHGQRPSSRILRIGTVAASDVVAADLGIDAGSPVVYLERLRLVDDLPFVLARTHYQAGLDTLLNIQEGESSWELIRKNHGMEIAHAAQTIDLCALSPADAGVLDEVPGSLGFRLHMVASDPEWRPIETTTALYRAQITRFYMELGESLAISSGDTETPTRRTLSTAHHQHLRPTEEETDADLKHF